MDLLILREYVIYLKNDTREGFYMIIDINTQRTIKTNEILSKNAKIKLLQINDDDLALVIKNIETENIFCITISLWCICLCIMYQCKYCKRSFSL